MDGPSFSGGPIHAFVRDWLLLKSVLDSQVVMADEHGGGLETADASRLASLGVLYKVSNGNPRSKCMLTVL